MRVILVMGDNSRLARLMLVSEMLRHIEVPVISLNKPIDTFQKEIPNKILADTIPEIKLEKRPKAYRSLVERIKSYRSHQLGSIRRNLRSAM